MPNKKSLIVLLAVAGLALGVLSTPALVFATSTEQVLHSFNYNDGTVPVASLIFDAAGNLYGTTEGDGPYGGGTAFELVPGANGWGYEVLYNFCSATGCADGGLPESRLIMDAVGNLYGTTSQGGNSRCGHGCGTVFQLTPSGGGTWTQTVLYTFTGGKDGGSPAAGLVFDAAGNLYGTTSQGGSHSMDCGSVGCGVVFELISQANGKWTEKVLHTFCSSTGCRDGMTPNGLIFDAAGNLYTSTSQGGNYGGGAVFRLAPSASGQRTGKVLHSFGKGKDGASPYGELVFDAAGNLYGTTNRGGGYIGGTVFRLSPGANGTWNEKILHRFCPKSECQDGAYPYAGVILDAADSLYGTTYYGGSYGLGTVFKLTPGANDRWRETVLYDSDGGNPDAGLTWDTVGNLYSTTANGGYYGLGTVFEITP